MEHATTYTQPQGIEAPEIEIYYKTAVNVGKRPTISTPTMFIIQCSESAK